MPKTNRTIHSLNKEEIEDKINQYLNVREDEKKTYGEVFTPLQLINEMLDKLPNDVWSNPDLKWLDPANGIGNFPMAIYMRLMTGLEKWEPNGQKRSKWIVHKMLYMIEINPRNVKIAKSIFGSGANICCGNFLENSSKCLRKFGVETFDIIVGNPPFQDSKAGDHVAQGWHDIYPAFFIKSIELLKENGYLAFINPAKWRAPDKKGDLKKMWELFVRNNPLFLKIFSPSETNKLFQKGASTRIDYYILQKNENGEKYKYTVVVDEEGKEQRLNVRHWDFLPNYDFNNIKRILSKNGLNIIYGSTQYEKRKPYVSETKHDAFKYPVLHSHTSKDGNIFYWTNTKKDVTGHFVSMFGVPKVILIKGLYPYPYNDYKGEYGMSNYSFGIPIKTKKEGDDMVKAIQSDAFKRIIRATKWNSNFTDHNMFRYFKPDFYRHFLKNSSKKTQKRQHDKNRKTRKRK